MIRWRSGTVVRTTVTRPGVIECEVRVDDTVRRAMAYESLTGPIRSGDVVVLNAGASDLHLGTGGVDFVAWNRSRPLPASRIPGHIVKLRYTPWQLLCAAAEAEDGVAHEALREADDVGGMMVVVCGLHSQAVAVICAVRELLADVRLGFVMTDAGALPAAFSDAAASLRAQGLVCTVVTCGHAFGGDLEAVTVYSGLLAARLVAGCDVAVVGPGPGHVGTGTRFGFSGIEQGWIVDAVNVLKGRPVAALRISFADPRARHRGISHHSLTALGKVARTRATLGVPVLAEDRMQVLLEQLARPEMARHNSVVADGEAALIGLSRYAPHLKTMGRSPSHDDAYFLAAGAAAAAVCVGREER